jgi:hypothetical protein
VSAREPRVRVRAAGGRARRSTRAYQRGLSRLLRRVLLEVVLLRRRALRRVARAQL